MALVEKRNAARLVGTIRLTAEGLAAWKVKQDEKNEIMRITVRVSDLGRHAFYWLPNFGAYILVNSSMMVLYVYPKKLRTVPTTVLPACLSRSSFLCR
jgi:hypothetical protein